jgi:hypothetical protein
MQQRFAAVRDAYIEERLMRLEETWNRDALDSVHVEDRFFGWSDQ